MLKDIGKKFDCKRTRYIFCIRRLFFINLEAVLSVSTIQLRTDGYVKSDG